MFKKQEGITLVALVITIIVLLILAGVSISLIMGQNGVLTQASKAVVTNNDATAKQDVQMAVAGVYAQYMSEWATNSAVGDFTDYITVELLEANKTNESATFGGTLPSAITYSVNAGGGKTTVVTFSVSDDGTVTFAE